MKKTARTLCATAIFSTALLCASACVNIAYDGESREPKAKRSEVEVFSDPARLPSGFKVMGNVTASGPATVNSTEIQSDLVDFARKRGADGVLLLSIDRKPDGVLRPDQIYGMQPIGGKQTLAESASVTIKAQLLEFPKKDGAKAAKAAIEAIPDDSSALPAQTK